MFHRIVSVIFLSLVLFTVACSGQTEEQALAQLRALTRDGKLPPESVVAAIESRFSGKRTGVLAKLLRARIRFENGDFNGAAALLSGNVFRTRTGIADHALWLRGRALRSAGDHVAAVAAFAELMREFPDSVRARDAKLMWAESAIAAGRAVEVPPMLVDLSEANDADALLLTAKAYEAQGSQPEAIRYHRRTFFFAAGSAAASEAESRLTAFGEPLTPQTADELAARADRLLAAKNYSDSAAAFNDLAARFSAALTPELQLKRITALANAGKMPEAAAAFVSMPPNSKEKEEAYRQMVLGYARAKQWPSARSTADEMRQKFPKGSLVAKTFIEAGLAARDAKNRSDEGYFLNTALSAFPNAIEVAQAQFEAAWFQHEQKSYAVSARMLTDHLALYVDRDSTNRGKAGYWAARDSERAGLMPEACALYDALTYRYGSNWYGYLAFNRLTTLKNQGQCRSVTPPNETVARAAANLKTVTVAAETSTNKELTRAAKSEELSTIGLFDWAIDELNEAKRTAANSPKINLALAKHYRMKGDQVNALLSLARSYPDYAQMFPEEMGRDEWDIFYPLTHWADIKKWSQARGLDRYQVAGIIRQETIFDPRARSGANAYGLMQLLLPTARTVARVFGASAMPQTGEDLFDPALNIELGTAYMKQQFDKFGRLEFVAVAYNAGPGRVPQWRSSLPAEMDEFVEAIPFKETKGYVQGVIRNSAQYRRLYDENGEFKPNVGTRPLRSEIDSKTREQFVAENPEIQLDDGS